jgi:ankyrin repeat protein
LLDPPALRERLRPEDPVLPQDLKGEILPVLQGFMSSMEHLGTFLRYLEAHPEFCKILLKRYPTAMRDVIAIRSGLVATSPFLYERGVVPLLHFAVKNHNRELLIFLLENTDFFYAGGGERIGHVNSKDHHGDTALQIAVRLRYKEIVVDLLTHGADANARAFWGRIPLHEAEDREIIDALLSHGGDINAQDHSGATPLQFAIHKAGFGKKDVMRIFLDRGATYNLSDSNGKTPIYHAVDLRAPELLDELVAHGINFNAWDQNGETVLIHAIKEVNERVIDKLLARGVDVNAMDRDGITPLHHAVRQGLGRVTDVLLAHGAKDSVVD